MSNWWDRGARALVGGIGDVQTADIAPLNVTSEKLSANALQRSLTVACPVAPSANMGSTASGSTEYVLFRAIVPMVINRISVVPSSTYLNPANNGGIFLGANCSTMAYMALGTSQYDVGARQVFTLTNPNIAACSDVRLAIQVGSSGVVPNLMFQFDYLTSQ